MAWQYSYYDKPASFNRDQLLVEVWENGLYPQTFDYTDTQVIFGFKTALTGPEETTLSNTVSSHVGDPYWREKRDPWGIPGPLQQRGFWAEIHTLDIGNNKLTVKRVIDEETFTKECIISQTIKHLFDAGELAIGDRVLIIYQDSNEQMAVDKKAE